MPVAAVRGVDINYEVLGERGPWVALQPGGRRGLVGVRPLAEKIADAARRGGMEAVCRTEHFAEVISSNPANRERLMGLEPQRFIAVMEEWRRAFNKGAHHAVIGLSPAELRSLTMPACIIPGNDR